MQETRWRHSASYLLLTTHDLKCNHEEADPLLILLASHAAQTISSPDTAIFAIAYSIHISSQLLFASGVDNHRRVVSLCHTLVKTARDERASAHNERFERVKYIH